MARKLPPIPQPPYPRQLTTRVFEDTAAVLSRLTLPIEQFEMVCLEFAKQYKRDNPNFKPHLFFRACGLSEHSVIRLVGFAL